MLKTHISNIKCISTYNSTFSMTVMYITNSGSIIKQFKTRNAKVCVIGLGYVGLPLAIEFAEKGFKVHGYDVSEKKISDIVSSRFYREEPALNQKLKNVLGKNLVLSTDPDTLKSFDAGIICVPTPIDDTKYPDLTYMISAAKTLAKYLGKEKLIVLESTTYPTTLEHNIRPVIEKQASMIAGKDFYLASSPERIDPGNKNFSLRTIPKVVGGINSESTEVTVALYSQIIDRVIPVDSPRMAEATKILENVFRLINISLINEFAKAFEEMDIDTFKVVDATATKPFGYMPFYPSAGAGGHCVPVDPYYMVYIAKKYGKNSDFIELAGKINDSMKDHVILLATIGLNNAGKCFRNSRIGLLGVAYKPDINDMRNAVSPMIVEKLKNLGAEVCYYDPIVDEPGHEFTGAEKTDLMGVLSCDAVIMITNHDAFKSEKETIRLQLSQNKNAFIDCVNFFSAAPEGINYVGLGKPRTRPSG